MKAWPDELTGTVLRTLLPSRNVTLPVGVPVPGATGLMVAVKVRAWPNSDGLGPAVKAILVVVVIWLTWKLLEVTPLRKAEFAARLVLPAYLASMVCTPTLSVETGKLAT